MLSDDLLRKYFRIFILVVCILVLVMGFFWLNYLYGRHQRSLEEYAAISRAKTQEEVRQKAMLLRARGDSIYDQERQDLELSLANRAALLKSALYDVYFSQKEDPTAFIESLSQLVNEPKQGTDFSIYVVSDKESSIGTPPPNVEQIISPGINYQADQMIYYEVPPYLGVRIYVYTDYDQNVKELMKKNLITYAELDPQITIRDEKGDQITGSGAQFLPEDYFYHEEVSQKSGFSFGYFSKKADLERRIDEQRQLFSSFLKNHIWEMAGFLLIFTITSLVILRLIIQNMGDYYQRLNEGVVEAYRKRERLSDMPRFQHFALGESIDSVFREAYLREDEYRAEIQDLKDNLKKNKLQRLLLEKKLLRLNELPYTKDILFKYRVEEFSPIQLIREVHGRVDPDASLSLQDSPGTLKSDPGLFSDLLEEIFSLSHERKTRYEVELHREGSQLLLYFTLYRPGAVEDSKMQELKNKARLLGGVLLRHQIDPNTLHLVLSLNDA